MLRRARILPNSPALSKSNRLSIEYIACENTGLRSTATWKGLRHVTAPFFATNDDDNEMMPNHLSSLLVEMLRRPDCGLVYSGVVKAEGENEIYHEAPNFTGATTRIAERRELKFLDHFDIDRLLRYDNISNPTHGSRAENF